VTLAIGPGGVDFEDYVRLRLFDQTFYGSSERSLVAGVMQNRRLVAQVNFRADWNCIFTNKIAMTHYLAAHGLPVLPIDMLFSHRAHPAAADVLTTQADLESFLRDPGTYPLFGKPVEGFQSLGTISLRRYLSEQDVAETASGHFIRVKDLSGSILAAYADGYIFQELVRSHAAMRRICGEGTGTARLLTINDQGKIRVARACLKIPAARNAADNYWRPGNILASLNLETGEITGACSGVGLEMKPVVRHPDTGAHLVGEAVPNWPGLIQMAIAGAKVVERVPLIGWDIASTESGPAIVEMNGTPDLLLHQLADRRGMLDETFVAFVKSQKRLAAAWKPCATRTSPAASKLVP